MSSRDQSPPSKGTTASPPGPRWPRAVQTVDWYLRPTRFLEACHERYGDIFTIRVSGKLTFGPSATREAGTWVMLTHPEHVKQIFTTDPALLEAPSEFIEPVLGSRSIFVVEEPDHMVERKLLLPAFHGERVARFGDMMTEAAEAEIARWPVGEPFALVDPMKDITLEVIIRSMFGMAGADWLDNFRTTVRRMVDTLILGRTIVKLGVAGFVFGLDRVRAGRTASSLIDPVDELVFEEIRRRRAAADPDADDVLAMLLEARREDGSPMTDEEVRDQLMSLLVAGHETTGNTMAWAFERLVRNPDKLALLREDLAAGSYEYADAVIRETMRQRVVIPVIGRRIVEPIEVGGHLLPAGIQVGACSYLMHHRPDVYPEPHEFRPERFLEQGPGTYTWLPFGAGARRCVGAAFAQLEMRKILEAVVLQTDLRAVDERPERIVRKFIALTPKDGGRVVMERRRSPVGG